jgi:hypothetical protein
MHVLRLSVLESIMMHVTCNMCWYYHLHCSIFQPLCHYPYCSVSDRHASLFNCILNLNLVKNVGQFIQQYLTSSVTLAQGPESNMLMECGWTNRAGKTSS